MAPCVEGQPLRPHPAPALLTTLGHSMQRAIATFLSPHTRGMPLGRRSAIGGVRFRGDGEVEGEAAGRLPRPRRLDN